MPVSQTDILPGSRPTTLGETRQIHRDLRVVARDFWKSERFRSSEGAEPEPEPRKRPWDQEQSPLTLNLWFEAWEPLELREPGRVTRLGLLSANPPTLKRLHCIRCVQVQEGSSVSVWWGEFYEGDTICSTEVLTIEWGDVFCPLITSRERVNTSVLNVRHSTSHEDTHWVTETVAPAAVWV